MTLFDLLSRLSGDEVALLCRRGVLRENVLLWYEVTRCYLALPDSLRKMDRYALCARRNRIGDEQARKIVKRMLSPTGKSEHGETRTCTEKT